MSTAHPVSQVPGDAPALSPLKRAFLALEEAQARLARAEGTMREPIAVIGVGCRVPGADDPAAFWRLLAEGRDAIGPIPRGRFDIEAYYDPDPDAPGRFAVREAGFIRDVAGFDPSFFGISRREANGMDPQQRLLLEVSWEALEHAGQAPDRLQRSATGVYFGLTSSDYSCLQLKSGDVALLDSHYTSGVAHSVASGRVSYLLGLQGPSMTIDTACSSSLVAVHLACQALRAGECRMALAGGVNLILSVDLFIAFSHSRMLAPDGRCKTFDAAANGFARGEGCGVVVLKRLADAQADGDRILAVIRGSAVNQDGPSSGLTAPNGPAQEAVIHEALARASVMPAEVGFIETHGTGTQLGDPLEVQALGQVFGAGRDAVHPLRLASVKTNIGHLEAAAGVTGLIKVVLALQHRAIPAHLHFKTPSPHIAWAELPFEVPTTLQPWQPIGGSRIAGVSSFGFSGTNAHVVLEEAPVAASVKGHVSGEQIYTLSAKNEGALRALATAHAAALDGASAPLASLCFSANTGRARFAQRATVIADSVSALHRGLDALAQGQEAPGLRSAQLSRRDPPRVAFLFTGQGAQYAGMTRGLYDSAPAFRAALDRCVQVLDAHLPRPLLSLLFTAPGEASLLDRTECTQPALFAVEYALAELWRSWGVVPMAVMGHSVGELVAACVAGIMSLEDALVLVAERGRLMGSLPNGGAMAAIAAGEAEVLECMAQGAAQLAIAAVNAPDQTVVSGTSDAVEALCGAFEARGVRCQRLAVSHAFHSPLVEPVLAEFERAAGRVTWAAPRIRLVSNLTGAVAEPGLLTQAAYWRRHVRDPVRFADGVRSLAALRPDLCIEIGPHPALLTTVKSVLGEAAPVLVPSLRKGLPDRAQILDALATAHLEGLDIDWRAVHAGQHVARVELPTYRFQRERCWFQARPAIREASGRATGHPLLGVRLRSPLRDAVQFERTLGIDDFSFLRDHRVHGRAILPATAFLEAALAAGRAVLGEATTLENVVIAEPLAVGGDEVRLVQVVVHLTENGGASFEVLSAQVGSDVDDWQLHAQGLVQADRDAGGADVELRDDISERCDTPVDAQAHYAQLVAYGLDFGPSLRGLRGLRRRDGEAIADVTLPDGVGDGNWLLHPALLDACLQSLAAAIPASLAQGRAFLPLAIERYRWHRSPGPHVWAHIVAGVTGTTGDTIRADLRVFDAHGLVADLEGIILRPAAAKQSATAAPFYEVAWRPKPERVSWPKPRSLAEAMAGALDALADAHDLDGYGRATLALDAHVAERVSRALVAMGWQPRIGESFETPILAARLRIVPRYLRALGRLLDILAEENLLARDGGTWTVKRCLTETDAVLEHKLLLQEHPAAAARLEFVRRCGDMLPAILRGEVDPLHAIFPGGETHDAEALYRDSPEARVYNAFARDAVLSALGNRKAGQSLRVLEVGGGTGGTTAWLAPALPANDTEYLFTDLGAGLVARARERFAAHRFMRFQVLDLETDMATQGLVEGSFDLIVASNVIHATTDLRRTLTRLRALLAPGGLLLMLEITARERWVDLSFGLTEGWWRFTDTDLRPEYPLLPRSDWMNLLANCGFEAAALNPEHAASSEVVIAATRRCLDPATSGRWVVFADDGGVGERLARRLREGEARVELVRRGDAVAASADDGSLIVGDGLDAKRLRQVVAGAAGIAYLWPLDADIEMQNESDPSSRERGQRRLLEPLLATMRALGETSHEVRHAPALWVATRGAQALQGDALLALDASASWGLGRVVALEHPEWRPAWIDLDPADDVDAQADALAALMSQPEAEREVAIRGGHRFVARLVRSMAVTEAGSRPRRLVQGGHGLLDGLSLQDAAPRAPDPGEIQIRVLAAGLNFRDVMNAVAMRDDPEPLGGECAGRVTAVGQGVTTFAAGDAVAAVAEGCFATYAICDARQAVALPARMSYADAVTLPFAGMTALHSLADLGGIRSGQTVLVHAAAGGVGSVAVQIAQRTGATVIATAGSERKRAHLRALGVRHVLNSRSLDFADQALEITGGRGVDLVLNSLSGDFIDASVRCLAADGVFLEIGKRDIWDAARFGRERPKGRYHAIDLNVMRLADPAAWRALFERAMRDAIEGRLKPLALHAFPLSRAADAFRFMAQARHIGKVVLTEWDDVHAAVERLPPNATTLVTGGLSGLGLATAGLLVERGARHLVLTGRRAAAPEAEERIEVLRGHGAEIRVVQADVSRADEVGRLLSMIDAEMPPLRGVVHAAGVLDDAAVLQMDWTRFARVLAPKVDGAWALHVATRHRPLDYFVMYSSIAAVLGSAGQANHAAANAFLDALAAHRRAQGLPGQSIAWGAWGEIGAAAGRQVDQRIAAFGLGVITPEQGLDWLQALMTGGASHVIVSPIHWDVLLASGRGASPLLSEFHRSEAARTLPTGAKPLGTGASATLAADLAQASPARRHDLLVGFVGEQVARVLGATSGKVVDPRQPLQELGLDSLMAVELRNQLSTGLVLPRSLPATLVFDHPTLEALARALEFELQGAERTAPAPPDAAAPADAVGAIDGLSDDEIDRMFAAKMGRD